MINKYIIIALLTFLPFLELRYSIPVGILKGKVELPFGIVLRAYSLNPIIVFLVAVISNIIIGLVIFMLIDYIEKSIIKTKLSNFYKKIVEKNRKKVRKYVKRYGIIGLSLFIAIPLPGSGVYSGAIGAKAFGFKLKEFLLAEIIGVIIAAVIVTMICLGILRL